jgi:hypothetical protein
MRKLGAGVLAAALLGAVVSAACAQDADGGKAPPEDRAPWKRNKGSKPKPGAEKKPEKKETPPAPAAPSPAQRTAQEQRERQRNALLRRLQVCTRLRQVAHEAGDAELERHADELEARAWALFQQPGRPALAGSPDEAALQRRLEIGTALPQDRADRPAGPDERRAALKGGEVRP